MEILGHVPHLLGHGVAVHHEHHGTGGAAEFVDNLCASVKHEKIGPAFFSVTMNLSSDSITSWDIDELHSWLILDWEREPVVIHGGVGLSWLSGYQLTQYGGLPAVTDSSN